MMRRFLVILSFLFCSFYIVLQSDEIKVTMKNGTTINGELKELVATDHITLIIAGIETEIPMSEVSSVERNNPITPQKDNKSPHDTELSYGIYEITDIKNYPDSFNIKICDQYITMYLVRGGWFNMGYDDRHSLSWDTEPIHRVQLSSFYVSKQLINRNTVERLINSNKLSDNTKPYSVKKRKDVECVIDTIKQQMSLPYRLLTEAEWEYTALMPFADNIFINDKKHLEWCNDIWGKYRNESQVNPKGAMTGKTHVLRGYSHDASKWRRYKSGNLGWYNTYIRIAISADCINK